MFFTSSQDQRSSDKSGKIAERNFSSLTPSSESHLEQFRTYRVNEKQYTKSCSAILQRRCSLVKFCTLVVPRFIIWFCFVRSVTKVGLDHFLSRHNCESSTVALGGCSSQPTSREKKSLLTTYWRGGRGTIR